MLKTWLTLACLALTAFACQDGKDNVITVADINDATLDIHLESVRAATYDLNGAPLCHGNEAEAALPGIIKLLSGKVKVTASNDLSNNLKGRLTLKKNSYLISTVCLNGQSKVPLLTDHDCEVDLIQYLGPDVFKVLQTPGEYDLEALKNQGIIDGTIRLPDVPKLAKPIVAGQWQAAVEVFLSSGHVVTNVKVPAVGEWIYAS